MIPKTKAQKNLRDIILETELKEQERAERFREFAFEQKLKHMEIKQRLRA